MTKYKLQLSVAISLLLACAALPALAAPPADVKAPQVVQKAGNIAALLPIARIDRGTGKNKSEAIAKKGDEVRWLDTVLTDKGGRARLTLNDGSILSLGSQAQLKIVQHDAKAQQTSLELGFGRVRAEVTKVTQLGGGFTLRTPTAVAGVIGTDFASTGSQLSSEFVCISGAVSITGTDVPDRVVCNAGDYVKVDKGKAPTQPKPATPQQIQQVIQDTEPATISAFSPASVLVGSTVDISATGTHMQGINKVVISGAGVQAALNGATTATTASVKITAAADAQPGPRTVTFTKQNGQVTAAVLTVITPPGSAAAGGDPKKPYHDVLESERASAIASLNGLIVALQQSAGAAAQQIDLANKGGADTGGIAAQLKAQIDAVISAAQAAGSNDDQAAAKANQDFDAAFAQNPQDPNGDFKPVNDAMLAAFAAAHDQLGALIAQANDTINNIEQQGLTQVASGGVSGGAGGATVEQGAPFSFTSKTSGASAYQWSLCSASGSCTPISGFSSTSADFSGPTCSLNAGDYRAHLVATVGSNPVTEDYPLHVLPPSYGSPSDTIANLANAYTGLQPDQFMGYFDPIGFTGFNALQENVRKTFLTLSSMTINLVPSQANINCNDATMRADWAQKYTFKTGPQLVFQQSEQLTARLQRIPGKGWFIVDFQGDNGTVQGVPPGPQSVDIALPNLRILNLSHTGTRMGPVMNSIAGGPRRTDASSTPLAVSPGPVPFTALVVNDGSATLTQPTKLRFSLTDANNNELAGADVDIPVPLVPCGSPNCDPSKGVTVSGVIIVPNLLPGTQAQVTGVANPGCTTQVQDCTSSSTTAQSLVIGSVDLAVASITAPGQLIGTQPGVVVVVVKNVGGNTSTPTTLVLTSDFGTNLSATIPVLAPDRDTSQLAQPGVIFNLGPIPANVSGNHSFTARISPAAQFDTNQSNDSLTQSLSVVGAFVDLKLLNLTLSAPGPWMGGDSRSVSFQLQNNGNVASSVNSTVTCQLTGGSNPAATLGSSQVGALSPNATSAVTTIPFTVPGGFAGNNDVITCTAGQDPLEAANKLADNTLTAPITVLPGVNLQFSPAITLATAYQMGSQQTLTVTVKNLGADTAHNVFVQVRLNCNPFTTCTPNNALNTTSNVVTLAGGASTTFSFNWTVPQVQQAPADVTQPITLQIFANEQALPNSPTSTNIFIGNVRMVDFTLTGNGPPSGLVGVIGRAFGPSLWNVVTWLPLPYPLTPTFQVTGVPAGVTTQQLGATTLVFTGTPSGPAGTFVTNGAATVSGVTHNSSSTTTLRILNEISLTQPSVPSVFTTGGPSQFQIAETGGVYPVSVTIALPSGITTADPLTKAITQPGTIVWNLQAAPTTASGTYQIPVHATDPGATNGTAVVVVPGNVNLSAQVNVGAAPPIADYLPSLPILTGHSPAPFTGSNAVVLGENLTITIPILNQGATSPTGSITVTIDCFFGPATCNNPFTTAVPAPASGQSVNAVFNIPGTLTSQGTPGSYTAVVSLTTSISQFSTANDTEQLPFDLITFNLTASNPLPVQNILIGSTSNIPLTLAETGPSGATVPVTGTFNPPITGASIATVNASPGSFNAVVTTTNSVPALSSTAQLAGNLHGVVHSVNQPVQFFSAFFTNQTFPLNSPSDPVPIDNGGSQTTLSFELQGTWVNGSATLNIPPVTGLSITPSGTLLNPNQQFTITFSGSVGAGTNVIPVLIAAAIPNTNPPVTVSYTLFVKPQSIPDLNLATPVVAVGGRNLLNNPWLAGELLGFIVPVKNSGSAPSTGGEEIDLFVNNQFVGTGFVNSPIAPGATVNVQINATAPDPITSGSYALETDITHDATEGTLGNNTRFDTVQIADWTLAVVGAGSSDANPLQLCAAILITTGPNPCPSIALSKSTNVQLQLVSSGGSPLGSFPLAPSLLSTSMQLNLAQSNLTAGVGFQSGATVTEPSGNISGKFFAQAVATLGQAKRGATIHVANFNNPTINDFLFFTGNATSPTGSAINFSIGATSGSSPTIQVNGELPVYMTFSDTRNTCSVTCPGRSDITFTDPGNIVAGTQQLKNVPYLTQQGPVHWTAATQADGSLVGSGSAPVTVSAQSIATSAVAGNPTPAATGDVIGTLSFNIGDLGLNGPFCTELGPGKSAQMTNMSFVSISGFNVPSLTWSWTLPSGITVDTVSGSSTFNGSSYGTLPTFNFTNTTAVDGGFSDASLVVTAQNPQGDSVNVTFSTTLDLSAAGNGCAQIGAVRGGPGRTVKGAWGRGAIATTTHSVARPLTDTGRLPQLSINAADVSFTPSLPRSGDTVEVRFRISNSGDGDAHAVPVALEANGTVVAQETFDVAAGRSTLGALTWQNARAAGGATGVNFGPRVAPAQSRMRQLGGDGPALAGDDGSERRASSRLNVTLVIDPQRQVRQRGTSAAVALPRLTLAPGAGNAAGDLGAGASALGGGNRNLQRTVIEVGESNCAGFRFASGVASGCGGADLEINVDDAATGRYILAARNGLADLGPSGVTMPDIAAARFSQEAAAVAGHTYAVQLSGGRVATFTLQTIRNPQLVGAQARKVFHGGGAGGALRHLGGDGQAVETGDVSGSATRAQAHITFEVVYSTP